MMLTDRYVAATLRSIPTDKHDDIGRELRGSIADAIDARIAAGEDEAAAEAAVLADLGDPDRLAAGLAGRPLYLIGPELFLDWWRLLKALLWIAPLVGTVVLVVDLLGGSSAGAALGTGVWSAGFTVLQIAFWTTVVFAVLERSGTRSANLTGPWSVDRLPEIDEGRRVSLADTVFSVAALVFLIAVLIGQRTFSAHQDADGSPIPVLDPDLWTFWLPMLVAVLALEIVLEIVKAALGRWTVPLAAVNTVLGLLFAVPAVWLLTSDRLLNPAYFDAAFADGTEPMRLFTQGILVVVVVVAVWDIGEGWFKALRIRARVSAQ